MSVHLLTPAEATARLAASDDMHAPFLAAMLRDGSTAYVANAPAALHVVAVGDALVPVTTSSPAPGERSYVVSPTVHYVDYSMAELHKIGSRPAEALLRGVIGGMGVALRAGVVERVAFVNNYLLSTNLWPALAPRDVHDLVAAVAAAFPDCAVALRSVDAHGQPGLVGALRAAGARLVPARQVWVETAADIARKRLARKDIARLGRSAWRLVNVVEADAPRLAALYAMLYLDKYSRLNPQLTVRFFERAISGGWLVFRAFARDGDRANGLDAVLGYVVRTTGAGGERTMTQPVFGYDTALPREAGLYRLLSAQVFAEAQAHGLAMHLSAGAGGFKQARGATPTPEFLAVYDRHLPAARRVPWALLESLGTRIGLPLLRKYGL